jgi:hypothetical protein
MTDKLKVLDLFSGIGGFSLGLERTGGFETVAFCEIDPYCRRVLAKHWPDVPIYEDVRELHADGLGRIDLVCGGYPCQPFSHAGKRRGKEDDRHLWPEMYRLVDECRPSWVIGENVAGHISMGLDDVLSDLEALDYACRTFVIPACAVDAPHESGLLATPTRISNQMAPSMAKHPSCRLCQTPVADDAVLRARGKVNSRGEPKLSAQVLLWPTPTASEGTGAQPNTGRTGGKSLRETVLYPTPTARDWKDNGSSPAELARNSTTLATRAGGSLNPTWVEWLMGYPIGWTDLEHSETPSSPKSPS